VSLPFKLVLGLYRFVSNVGLRNKIVNFVPTVFTLPEESAVEGSGARTKQGVGCMNDFVMLGRS
jgi:hypothetical protein